MSDPYPFYARLQQETAAYKTVLPNGVEAFLVTRYEDVLAGLKDSRLGKNIYRARSGTPAPASDMGAKINQSSMLKADPPEHTRLRALAHAAFTPQYVNRLRGHIQEIADRQLDQVQDRGRMDLIDDFAFPLPITVICEMLGIPLEDDRKFRQWSSAMIAAGIIGNETPPVIPEIVLMLQYLGALIAQKRTSPGSDLISQLIAADDSGDRFNDTELLSTTLLLLIAGHETTVNLIGNGMLILLKNPDALEKLKGEPDKIKSAVEELLRYANPVQMVNRYALEDLEIGGVSIPRGSHLMLVVAAANHDPAFHADADRLSLEQADSHHLAFGQGIHYCLGAPLARLEGEIAFTTLLKRMPDIRLAVAADRLEWRPWSELRGLRALPVLF